MDDMSKPVLIAIDSSKHSVEAFHWYISTMHRKDAKLLLVFVANPPFQPSPYYTAMSHESWNNMLAKEKKKVREIELEWADRMKELGVGGKITAVFHVRPGEALVEAIKDHKVRLVVMGSRGLGKLRRTILGSVSEYVLHHVHCPVIIYRNKEEVRERSDSRSSSGGSRSRANSSRSRTNSEPTERTRGSSQTEYKQSPLAQ